MFDCHDDLLTYIYQKRNDIEFLKSYCSKIFNPNNIKVGIFNLFFMSPDEMQEELGFSKDELNPVKQLSCVTELINVHSLIPSKTKSIFGIEGLDYLHSLDDIDLLYDLGIRSVAIVWNNKNQFGSGNRSSCGLTPLGKLLVTKLVDKRIAIDLSHANLKTFFDIIKLCNILKQQGKDPIVFASHSNAKTIYSDSRNLTDEQIQAIAQLDGVIGVVQIKRFCDYLDIENLTNISDDFSRKISCTYITYKVASWQCSKYCCCH